MGDAWVYEGALFFVQVYELMLVKIVWILWLL